MNRKLLTTNNAENEATDGKQSLQKPEDVKNGAVENGAVAVAVAANGVAPREQTAVVENGAVAVAANGVAPDDANPSTKVVAVANGC